MSHRPNLRLKSARKAAGLTQVQLADLSGLSQRLVSSLESGERTGSVETYTKLGKVLGVSVSYLLGERVVDKMSTVLREQIIADPSSPPELMNLARNVQLCESLAIEPEEWAFLRALQSPHILNRNAYVAILQVARLCRAVG